ncbi:MAG: DUF1566 domain-containing protein [Elusimicrobiales bacterium]
MKIINALILLSWAFSYFALYAEAGSTHTFNSGMNCNGVWRLPDTGQTQCYDSQATPVVGTCPGGGDGSGPAGQDGSYGPAAVQMSYKDNGNGTITDNITGLMWVKDPKAVCASCPGGYVSSGTYTWEMGLNQCENADYAGFTDWRLPNVRELMSIVDYGKTTSPVINTTYFLNTQTDYYWTSTTNTSASDQVWCVYFLNSFVSSVFKSSTKNVRCVRGGTY